MGDKPFSSRSGDFVSLLRETGHAPFATVSAENRSGLTTTEATTVLGFHYKDGVVIAGDRRATAGNTVVYDRADKVIEVDLHTVMAIAGTPATAFEMARVLQHSFQYYRRSQLQPLSVEAKVRALGKLIKDNLGLTLQGVGVVVPILAAQGPEEGSPPRLYFYDALGAQFQAADFAVSGSGSPSVRSILQLALQLLDVAAESDTATGGIDRRSRIFPQVKLLTPAGIRSVPDEVLGQHFSAA
jgi:proteasome beta subunit